MSDTAINLLSSIPPKDLGYMILGLFGFVYTLSGVVIWCFKKAYDQKIETNAARDEYIDSTFKEMKTAMKYHENSMNRLNSKIIEQCHLVVDKVMAPLDRVSERTKFEIAELKTLTHELEIHTLGRTELLKQSAEMLGLKFEVLTEKMDVTNDFGKVIIKDLPELKAHVRQNSLNIRELATAYKEDKILPRKK